MTLSIPRYVGVLACLLLLALPARANINFDGNVASTLQNLDSQTGGRSNNEKFGFGEARGNIHVYGDIATGVSAYGELLLRSGGTNQVDVGELYMTVQKWSQYLDVKLGAYEVDFGNQHLNRSDNADVQSNPLIGNDLVEARAIQTGLELSGSSRRLAWAVGVTNGTRGADFQGHRGIALVGKLWANFTNRFSGAVSFYTVDHSSNAADTSSSNLFAQVDGEPYEVSFGETQDPTGIQGQDVTAWQLDLAYDFTRTRFAVLGGQYFDNDNNGSDPGSPEQSFSYWALEASHDFTRDFYLAARYSARSAGTLQDTSSNVNRGGDQMRYQVGAGYSVSDNSLAKLEYVLQEEDLTAQQNEFSGVLGEFSVFF